ncbi:MAG: TldD/PmbA family protein [Desulfurococcaceae archaeon]
MREVYEKLIQKAVGAGLSEVEVYAVRSTIRQFKVSNDKIIDVVYREDEDIGLRGAVNKKTGSMRINTIQVDIDSIVKKLVSIVKASPEDPYWVGFPLNTEIVVQSSSYDDKIANMNEEEYVEILRNTMDKFKEPALLKGASKVSIAEGSFTVLEAEISILNSNGIMRSGLRSSVQMWLGLYVEKNGLQADKSFVYERSKLDEKLLLEKAFEEGEKALLFLNSSPIESGVYDVIFDPITTGEIITSSLAPAFSALNILENRSPLKNKLGEKVFNEKLVLIDDPTVDSATGSRSFDDEGVPTRTKHVVDKGILKTLLHSYYTAKRMNVEPTGNGLRSHPASQPLPGFTNIVISPGRGSIDEFVHDVRRGLIVYEIIGQWMSDPVTGSVKATVTHGLLVERGSVTRAVKGVVIGGNIYDMLSNELIEIGSDIEIVGNTVTPSIWIKDVKVAGI